MSYKKCTKCTHYHTDDQYCASPYTVYFPEYLGEEGEVVYAYSFEGAAEEFGRSFNDEGDLIREKIILKIVHKDGRTKYLEVSAEVNISYNTSDVGKDEYLKTLEL